MAFPGYPSDQIQNPVDFGAGEVDGKEDDLQALFVSKGRRFNGQVDGLLQRPFVGVFDDVFARGDLHHHPGNASIHGPLHIVNHATRESKDLGSQIPRDDLSDRCRIIGRDDGHAGLNAVDAGFSQRLGNANLVILGEGNAGLLLAVSESDVMDLDLVREVEGSLDLLGKIPGAHKPVFGFPGLIRHDEILLKSSLRQNEVLGELLWCAPGEGVATKFLIG